MPVVVVIIGTGLSFGLGFNKEYEVDVVGEIPVGYDLLPCAWQFDYITYSHIHMVMSYIFIYRTVVLIDYNFSRLPEPSFPILNLFGELILDSLIIAVVAYGFSLSMAKLIAKKFNYGINGNQELMGEVNVCHIDIFKSRN